MTSIASDDTSTPGADKHAPTPLCRSADADLWFPEQGDVGHEAKRVCYHCPVRSLCLDTAFRDDERHGIWGGLTEAERTKLSRTRGRRRTDLLARYEDEMRRIATKPAPEPRPYQTGRPVRPTTSAQSGPRVCGEGHRVDGDNAIKDGRYPSGKQKLRCRICRDRRRPTRPPAIKTVHEAAIDGTCVAGHPVTGDNAWRNGTYGDGRPRYVCATCNVARVRDAA